MRSFIVTTAAALGLALAAGTARADHGRDAGYFVGGALLGAALVELAHDRRHGRYHAYPRHRHYYEPHGHRHVYVHVHRGKHKHKHGRYGRDLHVYRVEPRYGWRHGRRYVYRYDD